MDRRMRLCDWNYIAKKKFADMLVSDALLRKFKVQRLRKKEKVTYLLPLKGPLRKTRSGKGDPEGQTPSLVRKKSPL